MKVVILSFITLLHLATCQVGETYLNRGFMVSEGLPYGKFVRISFRTNLLFKAASEEKRLAYIKQEIWDRFSTGILKIYEDEDITKERTDDFDITLVENGVVVSKVGNVFFKIRPKKSIEHMKGCLVVYATPYPLTAIPTGTASAETPPVLALPLEIDQNCLEVEIRPQWVTSADWTSISHTIFGIIKIIMNIVMVAVIVLKPFLPEYSKIHASWIGQTVIYWQYLMYTGLTTGLFGGLINDIQDGMLKASREYFFVSAIPKFSSSFLKESNGFIVYKYFDNGLYPALTEETFLEILFLFLIVIVTFCVEFSTNQKLIKILREIKSTIGVFSMTPILVYMLYTLYVYSLLDNFSSFWAILNIVLVIFALLYYSIFSLGKMSLTVASINYLHSRGVYQDGKVDIEQCSDWAFDSYISMETNVVIRILEYILLGSTALAYCLTYEWSIMAVGYIFLVWIVMSLFTLNKINNFESGTPERALSLKIIKLSLAFNLCMVAQYLIFGCLYLFKSMSASAVKVFSVAYIIILFLTVAILLLQLALRIRSILIVPDYVKFAKKKDKKEKKNPHDFQPVNSKAENSQNEENVVEKENHVESKGKDQEVESKGEKDQVMVHSSGNGEI